MNRTIYYYYNSQGTLVFNYRDEYGRHIDHCYLYYSLREALQKFRCKTDSRQK